MGLFTYRITGAHCDTCGASTSGDPTWWATDHLLSHPYHTIQFDRQISGLTDEGAVVFLFGIVVVILIIALYFKVEKSSSTVAKHTPKYIPTSTPATKEVYIRNADGTLQKETVYLSTDSVVTPTHSKEELDALYYPEDEVRTVSSPGQTITFNIHLAEYPPSIGKLNYYSVSINDKFINSRCSLTPFPYKAGQGDVKITIQIVGDSETVTKDFVKTVIDGDRYRVLLIDGELCMKRIR